RDAPRAGVHLPDARGVAPRPPLRRGVGALGSGPLPGARLAPPGARRRGPLPRLLPGDRRRHGGGGAPRPGRSRPLGPERAMRAALLTVEIRGEHDVVSARQRARQLAELLGFGEQDRTRIATAVSEIARNAWLYAGGGKAEYAVEGWPPHRSLVVEISDRGPGIEDARAILEGRHTSRSGMGLGIVGAKRLMDAFRLTSAPGGGTRVVLGKELPAAAQDLGAQELAARVETLVRQRPQSVFEEMQQQNV